MYDKVLGNHIGIVVNDQDPEKRSRLQVFIPHLSNTIYSGWNDQLTDVSFKTFESGIFSPEIIQKLKDVLPWAESAVPCFGGGTSGHVNSFLGKAITNPFSNALAATQSLGEAAYNAAANAFNDLSKGYDNPTSQNLNSEGNAPINNPPVNGSLTFGSTAYGNVDIDPTTAQDIAQGKITFDDQFKGASGRTLEPGVSIASNSLPMGAWVKLTNSAGEPLTNPYNPTGVYRVDDTGGSQVNANIDFYAGSDKSLYNQLANIGGGTNSGGITATSADGTDIATMSRPVQRQGFVDTLHKALDTGSGSANGFFSKPAIGAKVWVFFHGGNIQVPVYFAAVMEANSSKVAYQS